MRLPLPFVVAGLLVAAPAAAQDLMTGGITQSWTSTQMLLNAEKQAWAAPECVRGGTWATDCGDAPQRAPVTAAADLSFTPSPERRKRNYASFVAKLRTADPAGAAQLAGEFARSDMIQAIGGRIAPYGLRTDNVADAMALYIETAAEAVSGKALAPDAGRLQALKAQMARAAGATAALRNATDAQKQELAEALLVQAALLGSASEAARAAAAPDRVRAVGEAAAQGARATLGIDLHRMTLTAQGLVAAR